MENLDKIDQQILDILQEEIPLTKRPYEAIAKQVDISENEVIDRVSKLKESGIIRRLSGFFESRALGYRSSLVAAKVKKENFPQAVELINSYAGITHNYERDHEYNIWFTLIARNEASMDYILEEIAQSDYIDDLIPFTVNKKYKINVVFNLDQIGEDNGK